MCVIMYKPKGVGALNVDWVQNAVDANTDGWGIAVLDTKRNLDVYRGFDDAQALEAASSFGEDYDVVFHARIGTSGLRDSSNLHPFPIFNSPGDLANPSSSPAAYLFHNGIVSVEEWDKTKSDTWHLARIWEAMYGANIVRKFRQKKWRSRQKKHLGSYSKFVLIDRDGISIINPTAGLWKDGVWHSNRSALDSPWQARQWAGYTSYRPNSLPVQDYTGTWTYADEESSLFNMSDSEPGLSVDFILQEWESDNRAASIEDTIYTYPSDQVALAIKELMRRAGSNLRVC